ncbi:DnaD domain-containing protein [Bacillus sp. 2205SS5-2]|uniref:DnaD domain-containing protein n=1 Tax=Bacillus sp. 2205SS5-2 TaxID=3109031 RepID=UPI003003C0FF
MALFRKVQTEFWNDPRVVEEMTPEDKYFFLYLLTNSSTSQIGIYQITKKQMAYDTGYSQESINALLERFINRHQNMIYNPETREIAIKNWGKYNLNRGGKPMLDCVESQLKSVKDVSLISYVSEQMENGSIKDIYDKYTTHEGNVKQGSKKSETASNKGFYDTSTIRGQEEEKEEEEVEVEVEVEDQLVNKSSATATIIQTFESCLCRLSPLQLASIQKWVEDVQEPEIVLEAIKIADDRNRRTFGFVEYLLREWADKKLTRLTHIQTYENSKFQVKSCQSNGAVGRDVPRENEFTFDLSAGEGGRWD